MSVAALIFAVQEADDPATEGPQPIVVAGQSVVEYQLRCAHFAGAQHILLLVERITQRDLAAVDRLAGDAIKVEIVRSAAEASDHVHPEELLLIMQPGVVAEPRLVRELVANGCPQLLSLSDAQGHEMLERIDATSCWSGIGCVTGALLRETAAEIGDWELCATLLRRALQSDVPYNNLDLAAAEAPTIAHLTSVQEATVFNRALIQRTPAVNTGLIDYLLWTPLTNASLPLLLRWQVEPVWFSAALALLGFLTLAVAVLGSPLLALGLFILSGFVVIVTRRLRAITLHSAGQLRWIVQARVLIGGLALIVLTKHMIDYGFVWAHYVLMIWILVEMIRISQFDPWFLGRPNLPIWRASPETLALILWIALFFQYPTLGFALCVGWAVVSSTVLSRSTIS